MSTSSNADRVMIDSDSDSSGDNEEYNFKRKRQKEEDSKRIVYDVKPKVNSNPIIPLPIAQLPNDYVSVLPTCKNSNKRLCVAERRRRFEESHKNFVKSPCEIQTKLTKIGVASINEETLLRIKKPIDALTNNKIKINGIKSEQAFVDSNATSEMQERIKLALKDWKWNSQEIKLDDDIAWIPPKVTPPLDSKTLSRWRKTGLPCLSSKEDHHFCKPKLLETLFDLKMLLSQMKDTTKQSARNRSNPYESIKNGDFLNRAAMKMANIDAILGFALTEPKTQTGDSVLGPNDLLYFADICSGPGGFTEYVLWRKKWDAKGFGFTLKGELDFKFGEFFSGPPESFEAYYGPANDGDIYNPNNFRGFVKHVLANTDGRGVHFLMADGGFSVQGQEIQQESLSQHICLSQVLFGLGLIRAGGHFVCKMFGTFTPFTVGLIYLLYNSFDLVTILKPITSRPANSERYIVCKWKREKERIMPTLEYLSKCHEEMWDASMKKTTNTVIEVVPIEVLKSNVTFFQYIFNSNNNLAERQIENLKRIFAFSLDPNLKTEHGDEIKAKCLDLWKLPVSIKKMVSMGTGPKFKSLSGSYDEGFVQKGETELLLDLIKSVFKSPYDWRCVVVEGNKKSSCRGFYMSLGGARNYIFRNNDWFKVDFPFSMCKDTVVYGEIVREADNNGGNVVQVFHIIDGMVLGGKDIRNLHYTQRHEMCVKFAKAMHSSTSNLMPVSVKNPIRMENIGDLIEGLKFKFFKDASAGASSSLVAPIDHTDETSAVIRPGGILLLKITKDPWLMSCSRSARRKYWFNTLNGESTFDVVESAIADFLFTMNHRVIWWWDKNMNLTTKRPSGESPVNTDKSTIHVYHIMEHINSVLHHK